jgi:putative transposase
MWRMWRHRVMLSYSYKFRLYPSKAVETKLLEHLELCRWLYNRLLEEINKNKNKNNQRDAQALIVQLKELDRDYNL